MSPNIYYIVDGRKFPSLNSANWHRAMIDFGRFTRPIIEFIFDYLEPEEYPLQKDEFLDIAQIGYTQILIILRLSCISPMNSNTSNMLIVKIKLLTLDELKWASSQHIASKGFTQKGKTIEMSIWTKVEKLIKDFRPTVIYKSCDDCLTPIVPTQDEIHSENHTWENHFDTIFATDPRNEGRVRNAQED